MKRETDKTKKQQAALQAKAIKCTCGTLLHLAECRGSIQKAEATRWTKPPDSAGRIERR